MYMRQSIQSGLIDLGDVGNFMLLGALRQCDDGWSLRMERLQSRATQRSREWKSLGFMG